VPPISLRGLPHNGEFAKKKSKITLQEKLHCEFAIAVSRETGSSSKLNKIAKSHLQSTPNLPATSG